MEFFKIIGTFFIQPLLWLGLLWTGVSYSLRIKSERANFKIALNKDFFEIRHFIKKGILWGIIGSIMSIIIGCYLPTKAIFLYECLAMVALLFIKRIDLSSIPLFILGLAAVVKGSSYLPVILFLIGLNYLVKTRLIGKKDTIWLSPKVHRRKQRSAEYRWSEFTVLPLVMYIPGNLMGQLFHFLPLIHFGEVHFNLMILPFFVGSAGKIQRTQIDERIENVKKRDGILAILAFIFALANLFVRQLGMIGIVVVIAAAIGFSLYHYLQTKKMRQQFNEVSDGIRVIAIRPDTPAEKMSLNPGDIILTCNNRPVKNEDQFYEALQLNSAYCHLKVKTYSGDLKITEGAIYNDSPYELGIVQFQSKY